MENRQSDDVKLDGKEISLSDGSLKSKRLGNIWYHHKWTIIIVAFFLSVFIIVGIQLITRVEYDANVTISGPDFIKNDRYYYLADDLSKKLTDDVNRDGKRVVSITSYPVFSENELYDINHSEKDSSGNYIKIVEQSENLSEYKNFLQHTQTSDSYILILSRYVYEPLKSADPSRLVSISDIFGTSLPEGTLEDGYGIKLSETALYRDSTELKSFADEYVICMLKLPDMASKKQTKAYNASLEYFKNLVG